MNLEEQCQDNQDNQMIQEKNEQKVVQKKTRSKKNKKQKQPSPTIKQIVINKRKLELVRQLEKDITKDAIKNKQFEIYN